MNMVSMRESMNGSFLKNETIQSVSTATAQLKRQIAAAKLAGLRYEGPFIAVHY